MSQTTGRNIHDMDQYTYCVNFDRIADSTDDWNNFIIRKTWLINNIGLDHWQTGGPPASRVFDRDLTCWRFRCQEDSLQFQLTWGWAYDSHT